MNYSESFEVVYILYGTTFCNSDNFFTFFNTSIGTFLSNRISSKPVLLLPTSSFDVA